MDVASNKKSFLLKKKPTPVVIHDPNFHFGNLSLPQCWVKQLCSTSTKGMQNSLFVSVAHCWPLHHFAVSVSTTFILTRGRSVKTHKMFILL